MTMSQILEIEYSRYKQKSTYLENKTFFSLYKNLAHYTLMRAQ